MNKQYKIFFGTISNHLNNHKSKKEELKRLLKSKKRIMELCEENKIVIDKIIEILDRVDELDESEFDELFETDKYAEELWKTINKYKNDIESCLNKETTLNKETVTLKKYYQKIYDLYQIDCNNIDIEISNIDLVISQLADISLDPNINTESLSTLYSAANKLNTLLDEFVSHIDNFYTESEANEHNANLEGAKHEGDKVVYTQQMANDHNATLDGAVSAGDVQVEEVLYTEQTANEYNATLEGAIHQCYEQHSFYLNTSEKMSKYTQHPDNTGLFDVLSIDENNIAEIKIVLSEKGWSDGIKHVNEEEIYHVQFPLNGTQRDENGVGLAGKKLMDMNNQEISQNYNYLYITADKTTDAITTEEANEYNTTLEGSVHEGDIKVAEVLYTEETANEHNATLPNAVSAGDVKDPEELYTEETANEYNATLPGAVKEGDPKVQQNQSDKK